MSEKHVSESLPTMRFDAAQPYREPTIAKVIRPQFRPCETAWQQKWLGLICHHPDVQTMATAVEKFCGRWFRNQPEGRVLVLCGSTGNGKTHCLKRVAEFARAAGFASAEKGFRTLPPKIWFNRWPETARSIIEKSVSAVAVLADSFEADLLLLDDLGAESDPYRSGETTDALCQLLSRRAERWTMISANFLPENWHERFDVRVADRLHRNGMTVAINAPSFAHQ